MEDKQVMPVVHSDTLAWMWDNLSDRVPMKLLRYLVPVTMVKPRWSKRSLAHLTIAGLTTSIDLLGSGNYPLPAL